MPSVKFNPVGDPPWVAAFDELVAHLCALCLAAGSAPPRLTELLGMRRFYTPLGSLGVFSDAGLVHLASAYSKSRSYAGSVA